jgi:hypothetical protein
MPTKDEGSQRRMMSLRTFTQTYDIGRTSTLAEIESTRLRARRCGRKILIAVDDAEEWAKGLPVIVRETTG